MAPRNPYYQHQALTCLGSSWRLNPRVASRSPRVAEPPGPRSNKTRGVQWFQWGNIKG